MHVKISCKCLVLSVKLFCRPAYAVDRFIAISMGRKKADPDTYREGINDLQINLPAGLAG